MGVPDPTAPDATQAPAAEGAAPTEPKPPRLEDLDARELRLHVLDQRIRELDTKLSRATVFFGVKRLSHEGYRVYVEGLREERAELENERLGLQLLRRHPRKE